MLNFDEIKTEVAQNTTVRESVVTLLRGVRIQLDLAGNDVPKLQALSEDLRRLRDDLATAVVDNTNVAGDATLNVTPK